MAFGFSPRTSILIKAHQQRSDRTIGQVPDALLCSRLPLPLAYVRLVAHQDTEQYRYLPLTNSDLRVALLGGGIAGTQQD